MEWVFVTPVQAVVLTIPPLLDVNALARDGICSTVRLIVAADARTSDELFWTFFLLPLLLPAPVQLSLTAGVAGADGLLVSGRIISLPLPLLDTCAGVGAGGHITSCILIVSVFILTVVVALAALAALAEVEGDASGADGWRPLKTIIVPSVLPPETVAAGAIGSSAAPLAGIWSKNLSIAMAGLCCILPRRCAGVPAPPIQRIILPLAAVHGLVVVREEEDEEEEQQSVSS